MITKKQWYEFIEDVDKLKLRGFRVYLFGDEVRTTRDNVLVTRTEVPDINKPHQTIYSHPHSIDNTTKIEKLYYGLEIRKSLFNKETTKNIGLH